MWEPGSMLMRGIAYSENSPPKYCSFCGLQLEERGTSNWTGFDIMTGEKLPPKVEWVLNCPRYGKAPSEWHDTYYWDGHERKT